MSDIVSLRASLIGACIGLARTCSNNPVTDQTEGLLLAGLHASDPAVAMTAEQLTRLIDRIHADKAQVSPNCVSCASPCGKNEDYDLSRLDSAAGDVRAVKLAVLANLQQMAHRGRMDQLVFDALFALAEDWDAEALRWYADETAARGL